MKNIPRIFINENLQNGTIIPANKDIVHYLTRVMRTDTCLVFGNGNEYNAKLTDDKKSLIIGDQTNHTDPSGDITLMFAPIKRTASEYWDCSTLNSVFPLLSEFFS